MDFERMGYLFHGEHFKECVSRRNARATFLVDIHIYIDILLYHCGPAAGTLSHLCRKVVDTVQVLGGPSTDA
jgi:hypothetical protein